MCGDSVSSFFTNASQQLGLKRMKTFNVAAPPTLDQEKMRKEAARSAKRRKRAAIGAYGHSDTRKTGPGGLDGKGTKTLLGGG